LKTDFSKSDTYFLYIARYPFHWLPVELKIFTLAGVITDPHFIALS